MFSTIVAGTFFLRTPSIVRSSQRAICYVSLSDARASTFLYIRNISAEENIS